MSLSVEQRMEPSANRMGLSHLLRDWMWLLLGMALGIGGTLFISALVQEESSSEQVVQRWTSAIQDQDLDALVALYAEDATWHDEALDDHFHGRAGIRIGWGLFHTEGFEIRELSVLSADDKGAAIRWVLAGARSPFTAEPWESIGVSILEFSGDEIVTETVYYDSADLTSR